MGQDPLDKVLEEIKGDLNKNDYVIDETTREFLTKDEINKRKLGAIKEILDDGCKIVNCKTRDILLSRR